MRKADDEIGAGGSRSSERQPVIKPGGRPTQRRTPVGVLPSAVPATRVRNRVKPSTVTPKPQRPSITEITYRMGHNGQASHESTIRRTPAPDSDVDASHDSPTSQPTATHAAVAQAQNDIENWLAGTGPQRVSRAGRRPRTNASTPDLGTAAQPVTASAADTTEAHTGRHALDLTPDPEAHPGRHALDPTPDPDTHTGRHARIDPAEPATQLPTRRALKEGTRTGSNDEPPTTRRAARNADHSRHGKHTNPSRLSTGRKRGILAALVAIALTALVLWLPTVKNPTTIAGPACAQPAPPAVGTRPGPTLMESGRPDLGPVHSSPIPGPLPEEVPTGMGIVPIPAATILDTHGGQGVNEPCRMTPGTALDIPVLGVPGIPQQGVSAGFLRISARAGSSKAAISAYPAGTDYLGTSVLTLNPGLAGDTIIPMPLGSDGKVTIRVADGDAHVVVGAVGYVPTDGTGAKFTRVTGGRVLDSDIAGGKWHRFATQLPEDAIGMFANVTGHANSGTMLTLGDSEASDHPSNGLVVGDNRVKDGSGMMFQPLAGPQASIFASKRAHATVDIHGVLREKDGVGFVPTPPIPLFDTRADDDPIPALRSDRAMPIQIGGTGGVPLGASAVYVAVTGDRSGGPGDVDAWRPSDDRPLTPQFTLTGHGQSTTTAIIPLNPEGRTFLQLHEGDADLAFDLLGYFEAIPGEAPPSDQPPSGDQPPAGQGLGEAVNRAPDASRTFGTEITSGPEDAHTTSARSASIGFKANGVDTFHCRMDQGQWRVCASPVAMRSLDYGPHTLEVRGIDDTGHGDPKTAILNWTVVPNSPGTVKPSGAITGVPKGTPLKRHEGDLVVKEAGKVIDAMDVNGFIIIKAPNVKITRTVVRGRSTDNSAGLINNAAGMRGLIIEDTLLSPAQESVYKDGFHGSNATIRRVESRGTVDGFKIFGGDNMLIESSWVHHLRYYDNLQGVKEQIPTHNDAIQVLSGTNHRFIGNNLSGGHNSAIQVTQDKGVVANLRFSQNWANDGGCSVNIATKPRGAISGLVISNNRFGRDQRNKNCAIVTHEKGGSYGGNVWEDNGSPVKVTFDKPR